jgi:hypothetical protein
MKLNLVISFDDTGSMSSIRKQVRSQITRLINDLFKLIPEIEDLYTELVNRAK